MAFPIGEHFAPDDPPPGFSQLRPVEKTAMGHASVMHLHDLRIRSEHHAGCLLKIAAERRQDVRIGICIQQQHRLAMKQVAFAAKA